MSRIHYDPRAQARRELNAARKLVKPAPDRESIVLSVGLGLGCFAMSALVAACVAATYPF